MIAATAALFVLAGVGCGREAVAPVAVERMFELAALGSAATSTDFEAFVPGAIHGQFDWQSIGGAGSSSTASRCATYDHVIADAGLPSSLGGRALRVSNAVTSGCYTDQTFSQRSPDVVGQAGAVSRSRDGTVEYALPGASRRNRLDASWTLLSAVPDAWQPGLEVVVSPGRGDDLRMSWVQMQDLADGIAVRFGERTNPANPGAIQVTTVAIGLDRAVSHTIRLVLDVRDGALNDVVQVFVDGALRHTGGSWETYYALEPNGMLNFGGNPPAVNRLMFRTGSDALRGVPGDAAPATLGKGFLFDRVRVDAYSLPLSRDDCKGEGWRDFRSGDGALFGNQGDCMSWVVANLKTR